MEIRLIQGKTAIIGDHDWPLVSSYHWYAIRSTDGKRWYAVAAIPGQKNKARIKMHNLILGCKWIDHIDDDGLNNTRSNLRPCTNAQNQQNTKARGGKSGFKGVSWYGRYEKWRVAFNWQGKTYFIGYYEDEIEAARAYNTAVLPLAGAFVRLNVI